MSDVSMLASVSVSTISPRLSLRRLRVQRVGVAVLGLVLGACSESRPWALPEGCPDYRADMSPALTDACVGCHGPERSEGGYRLDSYGGVVAADDTGALRVVAGDAASPLLRMAEGAAGHPSASADVQELLRRWVTTCELSYFSSNVSHGGAWVNPHAEDFHGKVLRESDWNFDACAACHGAPDDAAGGASGLSCTACHPQGATACNVCHGSLANAAPPRPTSSSDRPREISVGAHQTHVRGGVLGRTFDCSVCHTVPQSYRDTGHIDGPPAEVLLSGLATADGTDVSWDVEQTTCSVYCHGVTLTGGTHTVPVWSVVDGSEARCGACHGLPPPAPHAQRSDCNACHPTVDAVMNFINPSYHIDGEVNLSGLGCGTCHGSEASPAPPVDLNGESDTLLRGVGAHEQHLESSDWHAAVLCTDCHRVPASLSSAGHTDSAPPAEVELGVLAQTDGAQATWNGDTCMTYCHGATLSGGAHVEPVWTQVDGSQSACDSCHGMPPTGNHTTYAQCDVCHGEVVAASGEGFVFVSPQLHVDGEVQYVPIHAANWAMPTQHGASFNAAGASACTSCHGADLTGGTSGVSCDDCHGGAWETACTFCHGGSGGDTTGAPPYGVDGESATTTRQVGAHRQHLQSSTWRAALACNACHTVPSSALSAGHVDASPAETTWGTLARTGSVTPTWTGTTCTNYCHGASLSGGTHSAAVWTTVDGSQVTCDGCHGLPPSAGHPQMSDCSACHGAVVAANDTTIIAANLHINGTVEATSYHPTNWDLPTQHGASFNASGASACTSCHGADLSGGTSGVSCDACHSTATWETACTFCHGGSGGDTTGAPPYGVDGESATTTRQVGAHRQHLQSSTWRAALACNACHTVPSSALSAGHVDASPAETTWGTLARTGSVTPTWTGTTCTNYCHGASLSGGTHSAAVWTTVDGSQVTCDGCHGLPPSAGHPQMSDCSACHGAVVAANDTTIIAANLHINGTVEATSYHPTNWDLPTQHGASFNASGASACTSCHGADLTGGTSGVSCESCHGGWKTNCTFCHGGTSNTTGAPPAGVDGETSRTVLQVGAHTEHVTTSNTHVAWTCSRCHVVPTSALSAGHIDGNGRAEVAFDSFNPSATYTTSTGVCSNMYCHSNGVSSAGTNDWDTNPTLTCSSCHGSPPLTGKHNKHVNNAGFACSECHSAVISSGSSTITNKTRHIDALKDVSLSGWSASTQRCTLTCHGENHTNDSW